MIYVGDAAQFYFGKNNPVKFNSIWDRQDHSYPTFPVLQHGVLYCPQGSSTKPENGHCDCLQVQVLLLLSYLVVRRVHQGAPVVLDTSVLEWEDAGLVS